MTSDWPPLCDKVETSQKLIYTLVILHTRMAENERNKTPRTKIENYANMLCVNLYSYVN